MNVPAYGTVGNQTMGIGLGQDWRHAIYMAITGKDPFYRFRLTKLEQQRLLELARDPILENNSDSRSQAVKRSTEACARDYAIIAIMLYGGVFIEELISLEADAIIVENDEDFWISITGLNGKKHRQPLVSKVAGEAVTDYLSVTGRKTRDQGSLFLSTISESKERKPLTVELVFSILKFLMQAARVEPCRITPYTLRNSFSKEWLDSGRDVEVLQRVLRIESSEAMDSYIFDLDSFFINGEVNQ